MVLPSQAPTDHRLSLPVQGHCFGVDHTNQLGVIHSLATLADAKNWLAENSTSVLLLETGSGEAMMWAEVIADWPDELKARLGWCGQQPLVEALPVMIASQIGRYHYQDTEAAELNQWALAEWQTHSQQRLTWQAHEPTPSWIHPITIADSQTITSHTDIEICHQTVRKWASSLPTVNELCTAMLEAANNAAYHSPPHGKFEKCQPYAATEAREHVTVGWGRYHTDNDTTYLTWIDDQWGRLKAMHILPKLLRHINGEGLLDEGGRGHYLITVLLSGWLVAILPGKATRYLLWENQHHKTCQESLWILD